MTIRRYLSTVDFADAASEADILALGQLDAAANFSYVTTVPYAQAVTPEHVWWAQFEKAKANKIERGTWTRSDQPEMHNWPKRMRDQREKGALKQRQIDALKSIGFPFVLTKDNKTTHIRIQSGGQMDRVLKLHEKVKAGIPLMPDDQSDYDRLYGLMRTKSKQGRLAPRTAKMLDLLTP